MNIMSATKSITSLLIGIGIDKGYVKSVNDLVMNYFKNYMHLEEEKRLFMR